MSTTSLDKTRAATLGSQEMISRSAPLVHRGLTLLNELSLPERQRLSSVIQPRNTRHVRQIGILGQGRINDLVISPDGQFLAVATSIGIYLQHTGSMVTSDILETDTPVHNLTFTSDSLSLAAACGDGAIRVATLTRTESGAVALTSSPITFYSMANHPKWISFVEDNQTLLAVAGNGKLEMWPIQDLEDTQAYLPDAPVILIEEQGEVEAVAMAQNDGVLATVVSRPRGRHKAAVYLWQLPDFANSTPFLRPPAELPAASGRVTSLAFSSRPGLLASGSDNGHTSLWQIRQKTGGSIRADLIDTLRGGDGKVSCLAFSPDSRKMASGTSLGYLQMWTVRDGALLTSILAHTGAVKHLQFSADGRTLYSSGDDEIVFAWPLSTFAVDETDSAQPSVSLAFTPPLSCLTWLGERDDLAAGTSEGSLLLWSKADPAASDRTSNSSLPDVRVQAHNSALVSMASSEDGSLLATGSLDTSVQLWRVCGQGDPTAEPLALVASLSGHGAAVRAVALSPDGLHFAVGTQAGEVWLWPLPDETTDWAETHPALLIDQASLVWGLAFSPDWTRLAAACYDNRVLVWDIQHKPHADHIVQQPPLTLHGHTAAVQHVAFSPRSDIVASAAHDNTARLWYLAENEDSVIQSLAVEPTVLQGHTGSVTTVAFSPHGKVLATGSTDTTVRLWTHTDGALLKTLKGHTATVTGIAFSSNGTLLASASADGTIRLWGLNPLPS